MTHLEPGIGQGSSHDPPEPGIARDWTKEHHVTHLEPGIGRGGEEEAGEAPDGVGEGARYT